MCVINGNFKWEEIEGPELKTLDALIRCSGKVAISSDGKTASLALINRVFGNQRGVTCLFGWKHEDRHSFEIAGGKGIPDYIPCMLLEVRKGNFKKLKYKSIEPGSKTETEISRLEFDDPYMTFCPGEGWYDEYFSLDHAEV